VTAGRSPEKIVDTFCSSHCGGNCILRAHVRDGVIERIESDGGPEPQLRACAKGHAYRQRVYAPDRLLHPLKRVGARGKGEFTRISWDEALETVANALQRVRDTYGPEAIFFKASGGDSATLHSAMPFTKVLGLNGGFSTSWGVFSFEQAMYAELATYGTFDGSSRDDLLNSRLIILWATDVSNALAHTNTTWYLARAREKGARVVAVDPRHTDTTAVCADQWVPILPGTDAALLVAMAQVIIEEGLQDQAFLDRYTVGFSQYRAYLMGEEDGIPKTPAWAEVITGVPAAVTAALAREYATAKPAALITGISPGRTAFGEQYHRAAMALTALTGNVGKPGGSAGLRSLMTISTLPALRRGAFLPGVSNPVASSYGRGVRCFLPARTKRYGGMGNVNTPHLADAFLKGKSGGYPADYRLLFIVNTSFPNQYLNINKSISALKGLEFVVSLEQFMTPTARWSDIVLPTCTFLERNDIVEEERGLFLGWQNKVIEPRGESRSHFRIAQDLAGKLGLREFEGLTEEGVLKDMVKGSAIADIAAFKRTLRWRVAPPGPHVAFRDEILDPANHPFPTPSGKIEIYSQQLADMHDPEMPPVPKYIEAWEGRRDPLARKYPLQLITIHPRRRAHTQYETVRWLRETQEQGVQLNPLDARARGIAHGDMVRVFNDRGATLLPAQLTARIVPGVVSILEGAWYDPAPDGADRGGGPNVLTKDASSPGGGFITNSCLVQVEKLA
jgi:anaerobic dimethyl sulfoxide reductase subunit A